MHDTRSARWPKLLGAIVLACLVWAVFFPILGFEFMEYDVGVQVLSNPYIRAFNAENVKHILTKRCITSYYPVRTLSYAVDYHFWGLNPLGFKLTNVLIHLGNVLLVFWLALRLLRHSREADGSPQPWRDLSVATFAAGLFAIHPVVVEPVTWVAGREELLAALGMLGTVHFHLSARWLREAGGKPRWVVGYHVMAALCFAAACLSNAVAAVTAAVVTVYDLITLSRPRLWRIFYGTCALWLIGVATFASIKFGREAPDVATQALGVHAETAKKLDRISDNILGEVRTFSAARARRAFNVYWLNLKALVWPLDLAFWYSPVEPKSFGEAGVILGLAAVGLSCLALWVLRRQKLILFGLLWFGIALVPSAQALPFTEHPVHIADRYLYMPLVALVVAVAMGLGRLVAGVRGPIATGGLIVAGALGLLLPAILSTGQVQTWKDDVTVWENCVRVDPENAMAHAALSSEWETRGVLDKAAEHRQEQMRLDFNNPKVMRLAGLWAASCEEQDRDYTVAVRLAKRACDLTRWEDSQCLLALAVVHSNYAHSLTELGQVSRGIENYREALKADPDYQPALFQLAVVLAACKDEKLRSPAEAVRLAERACRLADPPEPVGLMILSGIYARAWQNDKAIDTIRKAIELADAAGNQVMVGELQQQLKVYQDPLPPGSFPD